jgi:hypothetical protein
LLLLSGKQQIQLMGNSLMTKTKSMYLALIAVLLSPMAANADVIAIDLTSPGTEYDGVSYTLGFSFTLNTDVFVTSLGAYDSGMDGLDNRAQVGIWNAAGTLLESTFVGAGTAGELDGFFRFADIDSLALVTGVTYFIGSYLADSATSCNTGQGGACSIDPNVNVVTDQYSNWDSSFGFPGQTDSNDAGAWLGANFRFATSVPEPGTLALLGIGLAGMGLARRRRKV